MDLTCSLSIAPLYEEIPLGRRRLEILLVQDPPASGPSDAPKGWTSRRSQLKMYVQPSNDCRPNVWPCWAGSPEAAPAYPSGRRGTEGAALGRIACTVNVVGREVGA
jgi:hypothetical protein